MKEFFESDAGKAVLGLFMTAILIVWPLNAGWFVAALTLLYTVARLRAAFRELDEQEADDESTDALDEPEATTMAASPQANLLAMATPPSPTADAARGPRLRSAQA